MASDIEDLATEIRKSRQKWVIVEGKKDKAALENLGFKKIIILSKPLYAVVEIVVEKTKEVIILTDLDKEGKLLFAKLNSDLQSKGVTVRNRLRELLFKTQLRQIEGLDNYLKRNDMEIT